MSVALIVRHLQKLSRPDLQYPIARMVMLVPVYSIASQVALTSGLVAAQAAATIRDVYEVRRKSGVFWSPSAPPRQSALPQCPQVPFRGFSP